MSQKMGEALALRMQSAQDYDTIPVTLFLRGEPAAEALAALDAPAGTASTRGSVSEIKKQAAEQQADLLGSLRSMHGESAFTDGDVSVPQVSRIESFWIINAVTAWVTRGVIDQLLRRGDILLAELIRHVDEAELFDAGPKPKAAKATKKPKAAAGVADASPVVWSVDRVKAPMLWQLGLKGKGVLAAIIDSGVNYNHPDLTGHMWAGGAAFPNHGYDFASGDNDPMDEQGHGTCCAGIVAGDGSAGEATGVAPEATVMAIRVGGSEVNFWKGFEFAIDQKAHVISMSMSWKYPSSPNYPGWRRACETLLAAGILHANSIGNQGDDLTTYPLPYNIATPGNCPPPRMHPLQAIVGGLSSPISCGATDDLDQLASYSGRGPAAWEAAPYTDYPYSGGAKTGLIKPDVCAPGPGTRSCNWKYGVDTGARPYVGFGGTSAATPHVGGCLVLLAQACLKANKPIIPARIQEALENTAVRVVGQSKDKEIHYGAGRVDVYAAYKYGNALGWW